MDGPRETTQLTILIYSAIGIALLLLLTIIFGATKDQPYSYRPIQLATGEWSPYSGASLPHNGIASAIVTQVFNELGYQPQFKFMPWPSAEQKAASGETDSGIRGAFPYADTHQNIGHKDSRASKFYFSDSLLSVQMAVFYDRRHNQTGAQITSPADLADQRIILLAGYEYPPSMYQYIDLTTALFRQDNRQAFELLAHSTEPLILIEAIDVGFQLLEQTLPALLADIQAAPLKVELDIRLMLAKRNPNNLALIKRFNQKLAEFYAHDGASETLITQVKNQIEMDRAVRLIPLNGQTLVMGFEDAVGNRAVWLPSGSKAVVKQWHPHFLRFQSRPFITQPALVKVKLLNGPLAARQKALYVNAESIALATP